MKIKSQRRGKLRWPVGHCASGQKNNDKIRPRILGSQEISEEVIGEHLSLAELGDPDL